MDDERPCEHCGKKPTTMLSPKEAGVELQFGMAVMWRRSYAAGSCRYYATIADAYPQPAEVNVFLYVRLGSPEAPRTIRRKEVALGSELRLPTMAETAAIEQLVAEADQTERDDRARATEPEASPP